MKKELASSWWVLEKFYLSDNLEFRTEARRIITKKLGFEPDIRISMNSELVLRKDLRKVAEGEISLEELNICADIYVNSVRELIQEQYPEYLHLLDNRKKLSFFTVLDSLSG